jgi:hypothetical protein
MIGKVLRYFFIIEVPAKPILFQNLNDFLLCKRRGLRQTLSLSVVVTQKGYALHPEDVRVNHAFNCHREHHEVQ